MIYFKLLILVLFFTKNELKVLDTRSLDDFAMMIYKITGKNPLAYNGYGCWCGKGGSGTPIDATDQCCKTHDSCYDQAQALGCSVYVYDSYSYNIQSGSIKCLDDANSCKFKVCMCDKIAVECFKRHLNTFDDKKKCIPNSNIG